MTLAIRPYYCTLTITMLPTFFILVLLTGCAATPMIDAFIRAKAIEGDARAQYEIGERFPIHFADRVTSCSDSKDDNGVHRCKFPPIPQDAPERHPMAIIMP